MSSITPRSAALEDCCLSDRTVKPRRTTTISQSQGLKTLGLRPWRVAQTLVAYRLSPTCALAKFDPRLRGCGFSTSLDFGDKVAVIHQTFTAFDINNIAFHCNQPLDSMAVSPLSAVDLARIDTT